ncbi:MAG: TetR/AcrR family transcriptional regulator; helix-turn-helix transcriptional regulator [Dethiosulfatibacter sp.]|nr:TetR/AcrR family transcriptional regulator; helix-turn-helix transcriptional regulator [Dethiosulfatibacter sp.]
MEDSLLKIDEKRKISIINSAMEEFSKNTYEQASTNRIVKKAGISKGSLFNYFKSKKTLFDYLKIFSVKEIANAIVEKVNWEEPDLLKRVSEITLIKLEILRKYPHLIGFTKRINSYNSIEELKAIYEAYVPNIYEKVYSENIDFSLFREDIDIKVAMSILIWTFEKMGEDYFNKIRVGEEIDVDQMSIEVDKYIETLRKGFYK